MKYVSTRGAGEAVFASDAILRGIAEDGGLYVPEEIPKLPLPISDFAELSYRETAYEIMKLFFTDFTEEELSACIEKAYDGKFDTEEILKIREAGGLYYLELYHGRTLAFKDMALSILPHLMTTAAKKKGRKERVIILAATSGDTGKAALSGFADVERTAVCIFYPKDGVSAFQKKQMVSEPGKNTKAVGILGNFDDAQAAVKEIFLDEEFKKTLKEKNALLSSANSINIGRLIPQIVYYVFAYARLLKTGDLKEGELLDVAVPTGNFGNILAGYLAKRMGVPIGKLISASNTNKVLYDFFQTGIYDGNREFRVTLSPSMDILISSNLERLLYFLSEDGGKEVSSYMKELRETGRYRVSEEVFRKMKEFEAGFAAEEDTLRTIREVFEETGYGIDPHTAVGSFAAKEYRKRSETAGAILVASTASPYKFARTVLHALYPEKYGIRESNEEEKEWQLIRELKEILSLPDNPNVEAVLSGEILHGGIAEKTKLREEILGLLE